VRKSKLLERVCESDAFKRSFDCEQSVADREIALDCATNDTKVGLSIVGRSLIAA
jgi:hypothetical protein